MAAPSDVADGNAGPTTAGGENYVFSQHGNGPTGVPHSGGFNRNSSRYRQISRSTYFGGHENNLHALYNRSVPLRQVASNDDDVLTDENVKNYNTKQSRHLPPWAWYIIAAILGIRIRYRWLGWIFFGITIILALTFLVSFMWITIFDVTSHFTKSTALSGSMNILLAFYWCALGIYANRFAKKLFRSRNFVDSVRMHSKRIMKVSASVVLIVLAFLIVGMNSVAVVRDYGHGQCKNLTIPDPVCPILVGSRIGYSVLNALWNLLVGIVMLSVCRTHTIGIRRFIKEVEEDGRIYEQLFKQEVIDHLQASGVHAVHTRTGEHVGLEEPDGAEEYLNELQSDESDDDSIDGDADLEGFNYPLPSTLYEVNGLPPVTPFQHRRRLYSTRRSFRGSQTSLNSSIVNHGHTSSGFSNPGYGNPGFVNPGYATGRRMSQQEGAFATIHSQEALDGSMQIRKRTISSPVEATVDERKKSPNLETKQDTKPEDAKPLIDFEESSAVETIEEPSEATVKTQENPSEETSSRQPDICAGCQGNSKDGACQLCGAKDETDAEKGETSEDAGKNEDDNYSVLQGISPDDLKSMMLTNEEILFTHYKLQGDSDPDADPEDDRKSYRSKKSEVAADNSVDKLMMLTNEEILLAYFKIHVRLCSSSLAMQRWLTSWIAFILVWAAMFLIDLVSEEAQIIDIAQFVLTILIIPLLCSAYGEVNYECKRMIRRICPTPWRVEMLFYLDQMPLQMTAYGSPVSYGVISTTIGALGLAFFTKMVLTDVNWTD